jgi:hypothetical protein
VPLFLPVFTACSLEIAPSPGFARGAGKVMEGSLLCPPDRGILIGRAVWKVSIWRRRRGCIALIQVCSLVMSFSELHIYRNSHPTPRRLVNFPRPRVHRCARVLYPIHNRGMRQQLIHHCPLRMTSGSPCISKRSAFDERGRPEKYTYKC